MSNAPSLFQPITQKTLGFSGIIQNLAGDAKLIARLQELGFQCGEEALFQGVAPFGDPVLLAVRGARLALRRREAACILV